MGRLGIALGIQKRLRNSQPNTGSVTPIPVNTVLPAVTGTPQDGQVLTTTNGTWSNSPTSFTRQWYSNTINSVAGRTSLGQSGLTYTPGSAQVGLYIFSSVIAGNAGGSSVVQFSNIVGPVTAASGATLDPALIAPVMSLGGAGNAYPPSLNFDFTGATAIAGDKLCVAKSGAYPIPGSPTTARIVLTDAMIASGSFSFATDSDTPTFLSAITSPAVTYFKCFLERGTTSYGPDSNTIKHGDVTAPSMSTSSPTSAAENQLTIASLVFNEPVTLVSIGGTDASDIKVVETSASTTLTVQRFDGQQTNYEAKTSYDYSLLVADLGGNQTSVSVTSNITDQDEEPNSFTFTDVTNATRSTNYDSNTITIAGLGGGVSAPATVSGGQYSKNSGAFQAAGSFTVVNGDTIQLRAATSASYSTATNVVLTIGAVTDTYTVTTLADPALVAWAPETPPAGQSINNASNSATFSSINFGVGTGIVMVASSDRAITGVTVGGVAATKVVESDATARAVSIWKINIASAGAKTVVCTAAFGLKHIAIKTGTLGTSTPTETATATKGYGYNADPQATTGSITCPANGIVLVGLIGENVANSLTWAVGTDDGAVTEGVNSDGVRLATAVMRATGTPTANGLGGQGSAIAAAAWGP